MSVYLLVSGKINKETQPGLTVGSRGKGDRCDRLLTRGESIDIVASPFKKYIRINE
jgi:hypothetical protein